MAELIKYVGQEALSELVDQVKAEDAKVLAAAKDYTDKAPFDAQGSAATAEANAKAHADAEIAKLAEGQVATNKADIATLKGTGEGSVAKAVSDAKTEMQGKIDEVSGVANQNKADIAAINNAESGILAQAKAYADGEVAKVQGSVDAVVEKIGEVPEDKTVKDYIDEKTSGIATDAALGELQAAVDAVEGDVSTIKGDYLKGSDKTELEGKITEVTTAVATEKSRAEGVEAGLESRLAAVEGDYLKGADKEELQGNINTLTGVVEALRDGVDAEKVDGVLDLINYVEEHGPEVTGMKEDIAENAEAISGIAGRMTTAEGKITAVEGAVATKAEQSALDEAVEALEAKDTELAGKISALEGKFSGEGSVEDLIAAAKQEAIDAAASDAATKDEAVLAAAKKYADEEDAKVEARVATLETESAKHAAASDVTALAGRVTTAEGEIDTLQSEMDAVEAKAAANETAIGTINTELAKKAAQTDLEGAVARIAVNEGAISTINEELAEKAEAEALEAAVARIAANETAIAANTSKLNSFTAISPADVQALFA